MDNDPSGTNWSVPGSQAEPAALPAPPPPPGPAPDEVGVAPGAEQAGVTPRIVLKPMTVADILDGAFNIVKARPARILGITAVFVVPIHLLGAYAQRNTLGDTAMWDAITSRSPSLFNDAAESQSGNEQLGIILLGWIVPAFALTFVAAALALLVSGWVGGRDAAAGELLARTGRSWWALLASFVIVHLAEIAGTIFTCYLGLPFIMAFFVVVAPAIGAEGLGPLNAIKRSCSLAIRRFWQILGIALLIGLVATILNWALSALPQALTAWIGLERGWPLLAAGNIISALITTPFVAAATVLLYLDLRIRTEGLDIELDAMSLDQAVDR